MGAIRKSYWRSAVGRRLSAFCSRRSANDYARHFGPKAGAVLLISAIWGALLADAAARPDRSTFTARLVEAAIERTHHEVRYDPRYVKIPYPGGDVPSNTGVCTDEIIRIYRSVGVDLQKEVYEDMRAHYELYPHKWKWFKRQPDPNIDHRRVPNLIVFFRRKGVALPINRVGSDYLPGDIVTWDLGGGVDHIGIVVDRRGASEANMIVHNIGQGPKMEDVLFHWRITGHFRYYGPTAESR